MQSVIEDMALLTKGLTERGNLRLVYRQDNSCWLSRVESDFSCFLVPVSLCASLTLVQNKLCTQLSTTLHIP